MGNGDDIHNGSQDDSEQVASEGHDRLERQLAQYVFMREEREREVRLLFRDVPAAHIANSFRSAGATFITLSGERVEQASTAVEGTGPESGPAGDSQPRKRRRSRASRVPPGEITLRYFYALGGLVYTVNIVSPSGIAQSIAAIYPSADLSERELHERLSVVFVG